MNHTSPMRVASAQRCEQGHSDAVRLTVIASHPADRRELELCFSCPRASRYREVREVRHLPRTVPAAS